MSIFTFSRAALRRPLEGEFSSGFDDAMLLAAEEAIDHFAIPERTPLALANWELDSTLTAFGAQLARRHRSPLTAETYVRECEVFARYLSEVLRKKIIEAQEEDFWSYKAHRLKGPLSTRVQPVTWNKIAAALTRLRTHLKLPFDLYWRDWRESGGRDDTVRMIGLAEYKLFTDGGLARSARVALRNTAFAELLVTTGMRCSEANALLAIDLVPDAAFGERLSVKMELPSSITKGGHRRDIYYSRRVAHRYISAYLMEERDHFAQNYITRTFSRRRYTEAQLSRLGEYLFFENTAFGKIRPIGQLSGTATLPASILDPSERARSIRVKRDGSGFTIADVGPLWLSEGGIGLQRTTWNGVFRAAQARVQPSIHVTPHVLRHTFAVHYLNGLLKELVEWRTLRSTLNRRGEIYDRLVRDPLFQLQKRLGHRQLKTTLRYLTYIEEEREFVDRAVAEWDEKLSRERT